ncbi:MAG: hypothetical protein ACRC6R_02465 [Bacteroidales bacterium]
MMKNRLFTISFLYLSLSMLLLTFVGCSDDSSQDVFGGKLNFQLGFQGSVQTKSTSFAQLDVRYRISDSQGRIIKQIQSDYHPEQSTIVIEPLPIGEYTIYVLAFDKELEKCGLEVNDEIGSINDKWFSFKEGVVPVLLQDQLYYAKRDFEVTSETSLLQMVDLKYVLAGVDIQRQSSSSYLMNSMRRIDLTFPQSAKFYNEFTLNGEYKGEASASNSQASFLSSNAYYIMPQLSEEPIESTFVLYTQDHRGEQYKLSLSSDISYKEGVKQRVSLNFSSHPDARAGMIYVTSSYYDQEDRGLIFQDDEHHSVYCDASQRSFRINKMLQVTGGEDLTIHTRFYSARPISSVSIWSSDKMYGERVLLAYYDSIPAFCDARFALLDTTDKQQFVLESNAKISLSRQEIAELLSSELEIECDDSYWNMLQQIRAGWNVYFSTYGADPTQPNGGPAGNWRGIRPVHVREGVAIMTNIAYMISVPGYPEELATYQGKLWGNGGVDDIIDVSTIIPKLMSHQNFRIGLCGGVYGLGGGATLGFHQGVFLNHYRTPTSTANTIFHELGHCMGYSHSSAMTYGPWGAELSAPYYVNNVHTFPIHSSDILRSSENPNRY